MNRIKSGLSGVSVLSILLFTLIISAGFYVFSLEANAQCDAWIDYFVDEAGDGTCTVGFGANDFIGGTGVANCTFARNGNINCTCKGEHTTLLQSALIFNSDDHCCIFIGAEDPIESDITMGLGTPSGNMNATCKVRPE